MQTYYSALPLMPSASLLSKKYSTISRPSLKLLESSYSQIINHPEVKLPKFWHSTSCDDITALSLCEGGTAFFDTRTGNEIGSRIPTPDDGRYLIAFSPDGKWIAIQGDFKRTLDLWNVKTRTHVKTIDIKSEDLFQRITYSADGEKVMVITYGSLSLGPRPNRLHLGCQN
jgi:WD40 repeat protein